MQASGRRGERGSAARGQDGKSECTRDIVGVAEPGKEDRLKALLAGFRTCERIERGIVSTNPFSSLSLHLSPPLAFAPRYAGLNVHVRCRPWPQTRCQD